MCGTVCLSVFVRISAYMCVFAYVCLPFDSTLIPTNYIMYTSLVIMYMSTSIHEIASNCERANGFTSID